MKYLRYFSPFEYILWGGSVLAVVLSFVLCKNHDYLNLAGSLLGATMLIFTSKGNVIGQFMAVVFAVFYGYVSFRMQYYGELITYVGMSAPMAVAAIVSWLRHPHNGKRTEVKIGKLKLWEYPIILVLTAAVTAAFYFILTALCGGVRAERYCSHHSLVARDRGEHGIRRARGVFFRLSRQRPLRLL